MAPGTAKHWVYLGSCRSHCFYLWINLIDYRVRDGTLSWNSNSEAIRPTGWLSGQTEGNESRGASPSISQGGKEPPEHWRSFHFGSRGLESSCASLFWKRYSLAFPRIQCSGSVHDFVVTTYSSSLRVSSLTTKHTHSHQGSWIFWAQNLIPGLWVLGLGLTCLGFRWDHT